MKNYREEAERLVKTFSQEEKCRLLSGADFWHTKAIEGKLPSIMMADGPHGLRKQTASSYDGMSVAESYPSICYPTAATLGNTFNPELVYNVGAAIAEDALAEEVSLLLAPGVNIKRDPLCGRNFEYYSEDPYHSGTMGAAFINGVQSKGVGATVKHYALNNQENYRMTVNAVCDERAKREIYLKPFEIAVKEAAPEAVMCSYNRVDGIYASENGNLLKDILVGEWGFLGMTVSDWAAVNDRIEAVKNNLNLEMPGGVDDNDKKVLDALRDGSLSESVVDESVIKITELILRSLDRIQKDYKYDKENHYTVAREAAAEGAVLMKNDGILPLQNEGKFLIIGDLFKNTRYQGSGSSLINAERLITFEAAFREYGVDFDYAKGYNRRTAVTDKRLLGEAVQKAAGYEKVIIFAGLPALFESEGFDRRHMGIPENQVRLIDEVARINKNVIVVLCGGSVMELPFNDNVPAILNAYLCGQEGAYVIPRILFGDINPSGKLSETWGMRYADYPCSNLIKAPVVTEYRDSIFVGYRYFVTAGVPVRYPFGHGLSYTEFGFSSLTADKKMLKKGGMLKIAFTLSNTGKRYGGEVAQAYISKRESAVMRPKLELKAFKKVFLDVDKSEGIEFALKYEDFAIYNPIIKQWQVEGGEYFVYIGNSSANLPLSVNIEVEGEAVSIPYQESYKNLKPFEISGADFEALYGRPVPPNERNKKPYHYNTEIGDINRSLIGRIISRKALPNYTKKQIRDDENIEVTINMFKYGLIFNPLRSIVLSSCGILNFEALDAILLFLNGRRIRALKPLHKAFRKLRKF